MIHDILLYVLIAWLFDRQFILRNRYRYGWIVNADKSVYIWKFKQDVIGGPYYRDKVLFKIFKK